MSDYRSSVLAISVAVLIFGAACGGDSGGGDTSSERENTTDGSTRAEAAAEGDAAVATELDIQIARLVQVSGGDLYLTSTQFFSDIDFDGVKQVGVGALDFFAPVRLKIAKRMEKKASAAATALGEIAPQATTALEVAEKGGEAFDYFLKCASESAAFWAGVIDRTATFKVLSGAHRACEKAQKAQDRAEASVAALPEAAKKTTTGEAVPAGEDARVVVGIMDPSDPQEQEVVQPVAPGSKVTLIVDAENVSGFDWNLKKGCKGPLTFDVGMIVDLEGSPAIDPSEAGFTGSSLTRNEVEATVKGPERFEVEVGTFTIKEDASGPTRISISFSNNLCPDPGTGALYSPISVGAGLTHPVVLDVGG